MTTYVAPYTFHEGQLLRDVIADIGALIRRNAFAPPTLFPASQRYYAEKPDLDTGAGAWSALELRLSLIGYKLVRYYDANMDRVLLSVEPHDWHNFNFEATNGGRNWGIFIFNTRPTNYDIIEVPHPKYDLNAERLASEAFEKGDALALFVAGAHRFAINRDTPGTPPVIGDGGHTREFYDVKGKADVANQAAYVNPDNAVERRAVYDQNGSPNTPDPNSGFQWAHEGITTAIAADGFALKNRASLRVLQFHGYDYESHNTDYANIDIVVSP